MPAKYGNGSIWINDIKFPAPIRYPTFMVSTIVDSGRNANGVVVGQKIGRDQYKVDSLEWPHLDADTWSAMLKEFKNFYVKAKIPDMVNNKWITIKMYPGDRSAQPFKFSSSGLPTEYINCKVNIIDIGEGSI